MSPRLAAPSNLAPIASKSRQKISTLNLQSAANIDNNNFASKLSNLPNLESEHETEFESSKTNVPKGKVDEIQALLG